MTNPAESSELPAVESPVAHHPEIFLIGSPEPDDDTPEAPSESADDEFMPDILPETNAAPADGPASVASPAEVLPVIYHHLLG